jgi:L-seryl-tRNA(Ser) seleniumtransferase
VTTAVSQPDGLSNRTPVLRILWDPQKIGLSGNAVVRALNDGEPRITLVTTGGGGQGQPAQTGVSITPYMMAAGDERIIADRLHAVLSKPPAQPATPPLAAAAADISGQWNLRIQYAAIVTNHTLHVTQKGPDLGGFHQGEFTTREISGTLNGDTVQIRSAYGEQHGDSVNLTFSGKVTGNEMSGTLDMGEYLGATWTATKRGAGRRG